MDVLSPEEREHVKRASLLLRLARAMNLGRSKSTARVSISSRSRAVTILLTPPGRTSVDLELWAIEKDRDYFREVFGRELSAAAAA
jgi:exopolyphosphatase/guanosine-5'-triphosphate,3'-diphosphate pyrophosphatase